MLSEDSLGFADLKKRLGIESSGHLQHHLGKLGSLIKIDENGKYCLSEHGKDALFAVQTVENITKPQTKKVVERYSRGSAYPLLFLSLLLLVAFAWLQLASISTPNFLLLTFSSFIFLAVGTFLTFRAFVKSFEKRLCMVVAIIFILVTLLAANSLAQFPRGGIWSRGISAKPESFVLTIENRGTGFGYYYDGYSQVIYSARYPVSFVEVRTDSFANRIITINVSSHANLQGVVYMFLIFKPYAENTYAFFQKPAVFNESSSSAYFEVDLWLEWGNFQTRFEGYELEFLLRLDLRGPETAPHYLNFTVNTTFFQILVDDFIVDSSLQNGLGITLSGILIGINSYIPGKYLLEYSTKKLRKEK